MDYYYFPFSLVVVAWSKKRFYKLSKGLVLQRTVNKSNPMFKMKNDIMIVVLAHHNLILYWFVVY